MHHAITVATSGSKETNTPQATSIKLPSDVGNGESDIFDIPAEIASYYLDTCILYRAR